MLLGLKVEGDEGGAVDEGTKDLGDGEEAEEGFDGEVGEDEGMTSRGRSAMDG